MDDFHEDRITRDGGVGRVAHSLRSLVDSAKQWNLQAALRQTQEVTRQSVEDLRNWCIERDIVPQFKDFELFALLYCSARYSSDREQAQSVAQVYHDIRKKTPEVFSNRSFAGEDVQRALSHGYVCILPNKTPEGYRVVLQSLRNPDPTDFVYANNCKAQFLALDACIRAEPDTPGYIFLNDMKGVTMTHMWKWGFRLPKKIFTYMQYGMPLRTQRIHFLNTTPMMDRIMRMLRPLVRKEAMEMLHFHTAQDMENFFNMVPRHCVPEDYGGSLPSLEKLQVETDWFLEQMDGLLAS